jgi:hypothetical protein
VSCKFVAANLEGGSDVGCSAGECLFLCILESGSVDDLIAGGPLRIEDVVERQLLLIVCLVQPAK